MMMTVPESIVGFRLGNKIESFDGADPPRH